MIRQSSETSPDDETTNIDGPVVTAREVVSIRITHDELGVARCPLCRAVLVARQGREGPYFHCLCASQARKRAS